VDFHHLVVKAMKEEYSRNPSPKLLKDIQEVKKHIPQLQGQILKASGASQVKPIPPRSNYLHTEKSSWGQ